MNAKAITTLAAALAAGAIGVGATTGSDDQPQWQTALQLRSEGLNRQHGLGGHVEKRGAEQPAWLRALVIRSEALNRKYGLGRYARTPSGAEQPAWLRALIIRSDALNRQYELGEYAPGS